MILKGLEATAGQDSGLHKEQCCASYSSPRAGQGCWEPLGRAGSGQGSMEQLSGVSWCAQQPGNRDQHPWQRDCTGGAQQSPWNLPTSPLHCCIPWHQQEGLSWALLAFHVYWMELNLVSKE